MGPGNGRRCFHFHGLFYLFHNFYFFDNFLDHSLGFAGVLHDIQDALVGEEGRIHGLAVLGKHEALHLDGVGGLALLGDQVLVMGSAIGIVRQGDAQDNHLGHGELQLLGGVLILLGAEGHGGIVLPCQAVLEKTCQHAAVTHLHEDTGAVLVGLFGGGSEEHGIEELLLQQVCNILGVSLSGGVGVDGAAGLTEGQGIQVGTECLRSLLHVGTMEGTRYLQTDGLDAQAVQLLLQLGDALGVPRDHGLGGTVLVGHVDVFDALAEGDEVRLIGHAGHHGGVGIGLAHEGTAGLGHGDEGLVIHHAVGPQGHQLAEAMTDEGVGYQTAAIRQSIQTCLYGGQGGLGVGGVVDGRLGGGQLLCRKGLGIEGFGNGSLASLQEGVIGLTHGYAKLGVVDGHLGEHIDRLSPLAGEQDGDLATDLLAIVGDSLLGEGIGGNLLQKLQCSGALLGGLLGGFGHKGQTVQACSCILVAVLVPVEGDGRGGQGFDLGNQGFLTVGGEENAHGGGAYAVGIVTLALVLLQNHVEIGSAESEGADTCAADGLLVVDDPGMRLLQYGEAAVDEGGVGGLHIDGVGQDLVVEGQGYLHASGYASGQAHMAHLALDRTDDRLTLIAWGECRHHRADLTGIACGGSRTVGLDEADGIHIHAAVLVGTVEGPYLALTAGGVDALGAAVRGGTAAADDGIDLIAVPLGIREALENHDTHAVTDDHTVGIGIEGLDLSCLGAGWGFGKGQVGNGRIVQVGAAAEHDIHVSADQLVNSELHRAQGGAAGRIHRAGGTAQVEAVGDTACHHVGDIAGVIVLGPLVLGLQELLHDQIGGCLGDAVVDEDLADGVALGAAVEAEHVAGGAGGHDDTGLFPVEGASVLAVVARVH